MSKVDRVSYKAYLTKKKEKKVGIGYYSVWTPPEMFGNPIELRIAIGTFDDYSTLSHFIGRLSTIAEYAAVVYILREKMYNLKDLAKISGYSDTSSFHRSLRVSLLDVSNKPRSANIKTYLLALQAIEAAVSAERLVKAIAERDNNLIEILQRTIDLNYHKVNRNFLEKKEFAVHRLLEVAIDDRLHRSSQLTLPLGEEQ